MIYAFVSTVLECVSLTGCSTHRQSAFPHIRGYKSINRSIFSISGCEPFHLVAVNASEHEDSHGREEDENNDGRHNGQYQCSHVVAGQLIYKNQTKNYLNLV